MKYSILFILISCSVLSGFAQKENSHIRKGNDLFMEGNFADAEVEYRKAIEINPESFKATFNLADALYQQEKYEESIQEFRNVTARETNHERLGHTWHNIGNAYLAQDQYQQAIEAYKNALRFNPTDMDTKYNLAYAKKKLSEQQQGGGGQNQQQQDQQNQDKQDQQQQDQQNQNKDQQNKEDQQNQQNQQNKDKQDQQQQQQQKPKDGKISKEDAERLLEALKKNEEDTRQKVQEKQNQNSKRIRIEKDW